MRFTEAGGRSRSRVGIAGQPQFVSPLTEPMLGARPVAAYDVGRPMSALRERRPGRHLAADTDALHGRSA